MTVPGRLHREFTSHVLHAALVGQRDLELRQLADFPSAATPGNVAEHDRLAKALDAFPDFADRVLDLADSFFDPLHVVAQPADQREDVTAVFIIGNQARSQQHDGAKQAAEQNDERVAIEPDA